MPNSQDKTEIRLETSIAGMRREKSAIVRPCHRYALTFLSVVILMAPAVNPLDPAFRHELHAQAAPSAIVYSASFSPDGQYLAWSSNYGPVRLREVATGREVRTFMASHSLNGLPVVLCIAFSPGGRYLASGSQEPTVRLWDVTTGRQVHALAGHTSMVLSIAFSSDGRYLATGSQDCTVKIWEVAAGREVRTFSGHTARILAVSFSRDGRFVSAWGEDNTLKTWEITH